MPLPEREMRNVPRGNSAKGPSLRSRGLALKAGLALLLPALLMATPAQAAGGKVKLARKYRAGQSMVYVTKVHTNAKIDWVRRN